MKSIQDYLREDSKDAREIMSPAEENMSPADKVEAIHQKAKKDVILGSYAILGICLCCLLALIVYPQPTAQGMAAFLVCIAILAGYAIQRAGRYMKWHRRAREAAAQGHFEPYRDPRWVQLPFRLALLLGLVAVLLTNAPDVWGLGLISGGIVALIYLANHFFSGEEKKDK